MITIFSYLGTLFLQNTSSKELSIIASRLTPLSLFLEPTWMSGFVCLCMVFFFFSTSSPKLFLSESRVTSPSFWPSLWPDGSLGGMESTSPSLLTDGWRRCDHILSSDKKMLWLGKPSQCLANVWEPCDLHWTTKQPPATATTLSSWSWPVVFFVESSVKSPFTRKIRPMW